MASRYEHRPRGIFDRQVGRVIHPGDALWADYVAHLNAHGAIDPMPVPDAPSIDARRHECRARVNAERALRMQKITAVYNDDAFDADERSLASLTAWVALGRLPPRFTWRTADNRMVLLDEDAVRTLLYRVMEARDAHMRHAFQLKDLDLATAADPESVDIKEGWPT